MKQVNLYEAKTGLSALVEEAAAGEEIIIAKNGKARARLIAIAPASAPKRERKFGVGNHYGWKLPANFDDPDPEIEAMFYGLPVIAGNKDGSVDALCNGKFGILVDPGDINSLVKAIKDIISDRNNYLPDHNELVEHFGYTEYKRELNRCLNGLLQEA